MAVNIAVGDESFDEIRKTGLYYVDKSELLYDLVGQTNNKVTLFTRPRRFGKTLTMRMIESFFDIRRDSRAVFDGLAVMKHEEFCAEWMNRYPVLFITLKDAEGLNFQGAYGMLKAIIADTCKKHAYLAEANAVDKDDLAAFLRLKAQDGTGGDKTILCSFSAV